jgi:hypothetical protein
MTLAIDVSAGRPKPVARHRYPPAEGQWYVEPVGVSTALFGRERFVGAIWDPACGQGNVLAAAGICGLEAVGTDLVQRREEAIVQQMDFLGHRGRSLAPNIVCNPPYSDGAAERFIRHALDVARGKVAMLLEARFLFSEARAGGLWVHHPPTRIYNIVPRPSCPPGEHLATGAKAGGGAQECVWAVWDQTAPRSVTALYWLDWRKCNDKRRKGNERRDRRS